MDPKHVRQLLESVSRGELEIDEALEQLRQLPFRDLGFATVDHHRELRTGFPEVVMGEGKTSDQLVDLFKAIGEGARTVLATRVSAEKSRQLVEAIPEVRYDALSRTAVWIQEPVEPIGKDPVVIVSAGTSDQSVAEEAAITARTFGNTVETVYDVGVAGLHRILANQKTLDSAGVLIVVAGMEAALASVVAGLVSKPVIAVPTSVGYGASFGGLAALLAMMNSCAAGVTVVNIDNGFGAAVAASIIQRSLPTESGS
jgi:NCAIR mutase (PurE)-related protein